MNDCSSDLYLLTVCFEAALIQCLLARVPDEALPVCASNKA